MNVRSEKTPELVAVLLERDGSTARFRLTPHDAAVGELLASMGFPPQGGHFLRSFPDSDDVPRLFRNFTAHIDEMIQHKRRDLPTPWEPALEVVAERLSGKVDWWLSGSAALAVRGIDVKPRDLDLVVDDPKRTAELFHDVVIEPVIPMQGWVADWAGRAFDRALIEWVAGVHPDVEQGGRHEQGPDAARRRELVVWRNHRILCSPLDLQLAVTEARGLIEQAAAIRGYIEKQA